MTFETTPELIPNEEESFVLDAAPVWTTIPKKNFFQDLRASVLEFILSKIQKNGYTKD